MCSQEYILSLPANQRTSEQAWQVALESRPFVILLAKSLTNADKDRLNDLIQEGLIASYNVALKFNGAYNRTMYNAYLRRSILNMLGRYLLGLHVIPIKRSTSQAARLSSNNTSAINDARRTLALTRSTLEFSEIAHCPNESNDMSILLQSIDTLTENERGIILHYYGLGTAKIRSAEICRIMNLSALQVKYHRVKAFNKLKSLMRAS